MLEEIPTAPGGPGPAKYQVLMELGRGGMGVVSLAMSRGPQGFVKLVVLKTLHRQLVGDRQAHQMFLQEARISAQLSHPNVVQVYEVTAHDGAPTMVMEHLEGLTLSAILGQSPQPLPLTLHLPIIAKVLAGLHAAHELRDYGGAALNLIHRDVSPHNVFVLFDGQVKVLDFGIAKTTGSEVETRTGEIKGKVRYMAPEQAGQEAQDRRVDVFTVGLILWEALTGRRVWSQLPDGEVVSQLLQKRVPPLPPSADVPPELARICRRALAPIPDDRYATADEFRRDLERQARDPPGHGGADELAVFLRQNFRAARDARRDLIDAHVRAATSLGVEPGGEPTAALVTGVLRMPRPPQAAAPAPADVDADLGPTGAASPEPPPADTAIPAPAAMSATAPTLIAAHRSPAVPAMIGAVVAALVLAAATMISRGRGGGGADRSAEAGALARAGATPASAFAAGTCGAGLKLCDGQCVSIDHPGYGCGADSCAPCRTDNATARCNNRHQCDIAVCYQDWDDCDGNAANGCESNVRTDPDHCGGCAHRCPDLAHAERGCGDVCTIWRCTPGFRDCNGVDGDGCEANISGDPQNCGRCGRICNAGQTCRRGECEP